MNVNANPTNEPMRSTARELLVRLGGNKHTFHSAIAKTKPFLGTFKVTCTCGEVFEAAATDANVDAVRNVAEVRK